MVSTNPIIERALEAYDRFQISDKPPENLALIHDQQERFPRDNPYAEIDVLFIQHHLGPFIGRINAMVENGLNSERAWFVDIPYSTNENVISELKRLDFSDQQISPPFNNPLANYSSAQAERVSEIIEGIAHREGPRPLLVIDDGAYFTRYLNDLKISHPEKLEQFYGSSVVEQTTRGHRYICQYGLDVINRCGISVVSIARCQTKKEFEGPFIGAAVSRALKNSIGNNRIINANNIAVIGCGVVGMATMEEIIRFHPDARIDAIDIDSEARSSASDLSPNSRGLPQLREDTEYDLVFGCTGYNSFQLDQRKLLANDAILASGSSAAVEFNRAGFIELADEYDDDEIKIVNRTEALSTGIHSEIIIKHENERTFSFLNAGFPVNFDGRLECLPTRIIQATHGLLYAAGIQALETENPGLNTINPEYDEWIFTRAVNELAEAPELSGLNSRSN